MPSTEKELSLLVVDDHKMFCQAIQNSLKQNLNIKEVEIAFDGEEAVAMMREYQFDVIFMDYKMKHMNGDEAARRILELYPHIKIIAISMFEDKETVEAMFSAGCLGYVLKTSSIETLNEAIDKICAGEKYIDPVIFNTTSLLK